MQAYKLKAKIDNSGNLVINEPINMPPGEVEVIVLQPVAAPENLTATQPQTPKHQHLPAVKSLTELLATAPPVPPDFDPDVAKWEYLKEKHNL